MSEINSGFAVPASQRQSWGSLAMIWIGSMICVPCLMIGGYLGMGFTLGGVVLSVLIGYGIVCTYMCFMGMESCDTGLPTVSMAGAVLGDKGARYIISLMLAIACIGWFGIQSAVCGASFSAMLASMTGIAIPAWLSSIVWGLLMLLTAMYGYKALKYLNFVAVPALVLVIIYGVVAAFTKNNGGAVIAQYKPVAPMSLVAGISLTVATFALGGVISGDYSRFAKNRRDVIKSSVLGVLPAGLVMIVVGAVLSIVANQYDISAVLSAVGVPAFGLIALVLATWTTNVTNAYSGGIAVASLFGTDEKHFKIATAVAGGLGTLLAAFGLLSKFQVFLSILTAFIPPIAGVIIASYWIIGKGKKENVVAIQGFSASGIISFVLGAAVAYITGNVAVFFVSPINGIVVSMVSYVILHRVLDTKKA
ncbi:MAG: cytosine permease [Sphaerochaetaceae bacterium]